MGLAFISHPDCLLHDVGGETPEVPARLRSIENELDQSELRPFLTNEIAPLATREHLLRVHDEHYIDYIFKSAPETGLFVLDADTKMGPQSLQAALYAAGAVVHAVDLLMNGKSTVAFCNVRPPGHHAEYANAMGFCLFNNVAVGAAHAMEQYKMDRIVIIDFDVHHGNGIENIFKNDPRVLYCSSFQHPLYPYSGADTESSHIINIPLAAGSDGHLFREKAKERWLPAIIKFKPEMIFFSAGFDAHYNDAMSDLRWHEADYDWITREIVDIANSMCHGHIVSTLEGGYAIDTLGLCVAAHLRALLGTKKSV